MTFLEYLLSEAMGCQASDPRIQKAVESLHKARAVDPARLDRLDRDAKIYDLRMGKVGKPLDGAAIEIRMGVSRATVARAMRSQLEIRRKK